ncbi:MAG: hypothetical protein ACI9BO_002502, partial [Zhongshania sp.]
MLMKAKHPRSIALRSHTLALVFMTGLINQASASDLNTTHAEQPSKRPNIVLILADDLGFTDSAPYGSEISTPALSELAE